MHRKERPLVNPPPWDEPPAVVQALAEHDREKIDALQNLMERKSVGG